MLWVRTSALATVALLAALLAPAGAHAANVVTLAEPNVINASFIAGSGALTLSGTADANIASVEVTLTDAAQPEHSTTITATPADGAWTASFAALALADFADGPITASTNYAEAAGEPVESEQLNIRKDVIAPDPSLLTATPGLGTYRAAQRVTLSAPAGEVLHFTTDGSEPNASSPTVAGPIDVTQTTTIKTLAVDDAGNVGGVAAFPYVIDEVAPVTVVDVPGGFHRAPVPVTLTATDEGGAGVETTWYTTDGSDPTSAQSTRRPYDPGARPALRDGERISVASVDRVGNVEALKVSAAAQVDTDAPATTDDVPPEWQSEPVSVTLTADDGDGSGVATTWYTLDGSDPRTAGDARREYDAAHPPALQDGQSITYASADEVGNVAAPKTSRPAKVDATAPVTTADVPAGYVNADVVVTLDATDTGSGVAETWYTLDGSDPRIEDNAARHRYTSSAKPQLQHGQTIRFASIDRVGNVEPPTESQPARVDTTPPTTSDDVTGAWTGGSVEVTLTAADDGSGVAETYYTLDDSNPADADNPNRVRYVADSKPTLAHGQQIRYASVDVAGNVEAVKVSAAAQVDTAKPLTTDDVPAGWRGAPVEVTLIATDAGGSGVAGTYYTTDGSNPLDEENAARRLYDSARRPHLQHGERIRYATRDGAGNVEAAKTSAPAKVDATPPATTDDVPTAWQKAEVAVSLTATDTGSGPADTWYTTDGTNPADPANPKRLLYDPTSKPTLANGRSIRYASVDALGNVETAKSSPPAKVDTAAPATTDNVPGSFQNDDIVVSLARSDTGGSSVATTWYTLDGSDPTDPESSRAAYNPGARPKLADGQRIRYATVDNAGNVEAPRSSPIARVDKLAPVTRDDVPTDWQTANVTVTLTGDDGAGSGVATTWYTTDGSDPTVPTNLARRVYDPGAKPVLGPGQRIRYFSVDRMNNREPVRETAAKVDRTSPATTDNVPLGWRGSDITVTLTASDAGVRTVATTWYTLDGSDPTAADNPARRVYDPAAKPVLGHGGRIVYASADALGNVESPRTSLAAKVDTTAPATVDDVPAGAAGGPVTVALTATDRGGSGVVATWFTTDGSDPTVTTNPARRQYGDTVRPVLGHGERVRYYSVDAVGNAEAVAVSRAATVVEAPHPVAEPSVPASPAPVPAAPPAAPAAPPVAPAARPAPAPVAPALGSVRVASLLSQASVRARGIAVALKVARHAKVVRFEVVRLGGPTNARPLATLYRFPAAAGTLRTRLGSGAIKRLRPGVYELRISAGPRKAALGAAATRQLRISR